MDHQEEVVVVLFPSPGIGHLISMVELGKFILAQNKSPLISIIILTTNPPFNTGATSDYIRRVSSAVPSIRFHSLPPVTLPRDPNSYPNMESITFDTLRLHDPHVRSALQSISLSAHISAFIIDFFCLTAYSIAINLQIPTFHFWTSSVGGLSCCLYFPEIHNTIPGRLRDWKQSVEIPGMPSFAAADLPSTMLDRGTYGYDKFVELSFQMRGSCGIIVNSCDSLESDSLKAIRAGLCIPGQPSPPIYCIGPLIATGIVGEKVDAPRHECLTWLDSQPTRSVVYLCFGSQGDFSAEQLKEIAVGLERSGQRFLWVVCSPSSKETKQQYFLPRPEPDLDTLLPEGYLARVSGRGMVVKSWAPQVSVLGHESVGAFVTHCGWNSVLESVLLAGVPMVTWPLYAEQSMNKVILVEGLKLALAMNEEEGENGLVGAEKVEKRVREIMASEEAKCICDRARAAREAARAAMVENGTSVATLTKFMESLRSG